MSTPIGTGEYVRFKKPGFYGPRKYLVVGDIFWRGKRQLICMNIDTEYVEDYDERIMEVCNED